MRDPLGRLFPGLPRRVRVGLDWVLTIAGAIVIVFGLKMWVVNPYRIPSSSMEPTLHCAKPAPGCEARFSDRVLANRFIYHFRNPKRGEIIVFKTPGNKPVCGTTKVGEVFVKLGKQGSTLAGVMDAFSVAISVGLQYGIPLESYVAKFTNMRFEPAGITDDPDIRIASSVIDYIFRRLALDHLPYDQRADLSILSAAERSAVLSGEEPAMSADEADPVEMAQSVPVEHAQQHAEDAPARRPGDADPARPHSSTELIESQQGRVADAPLCLTCGTKMRPAGSCYVCEGCGSTSGCS